MGDTSSLTGDIANNATLQFAQTSNGSFGGDISGTGALVKTGNGTLTLTGSNSYTGGTTISGGTLVGNSDTLTGDIINNATIQFAQAEDGIFAGAISGAGSLIKSGAGTLTLTGEQSYTGGTTILGGLLIGSTNSVHGDVNNGGTLNFDQDGDGTFANNITGSGSLVKSGTGRLILTGQNNYTGGTVVQGGTLVVNGTITSDVDVRGGARMMGAGTIGGMIVRNQGTLAPGNSIDTLNVTGSVLFEQGSLYEVEVNAAGDADRLNAGGTVTIEGGTVAVLAENGEYAPFTTYTIITGGAIDGTFDNVTSDLAFLLPTLDYSANSVTLGLLRNDIAFSDVASTANQRAASGALENAFGADSALYAQLVQQTAEDARTAYDSMSGEIHASARRAMVQDTDRFRRSITSRTDMQASPRQNLWLQVAVAGDDVDQDGNAAGYKRDTMSYFGGAEFNAGGMMLGIAGGYTDGDLDVAARASQGNVEGTHVGLYGKVNAAIANVSFGATYSDFDVNTDRGISAGSIAETATASYSAETTEIFAEIGLPLREGASTIEPFVGVHRMWLSQDNFVETGADAGLYAHTQERSWSWSTVGARAHVPLAAEGKLALNMAARWQHALDGKAINADLAFLEGGQAFRVSGAPMAGDVGLVDAGLSFQASNGVQISVDYNGEWSDVSQSHGGKATLGIRF
ncbi:autotransporter-associated beta strand protein [Altererythrobacter atlanticus]|nr:autotransporter-associated beta strand protein [Croceibacterium atlanticum]